MHKFVCEGLILIILFVSFIGTIYISTQPEPLRQSVCGLTEMIKHRDYFYITLPSNVISKGPHEKNIISNYTTTLQTRCVFPNTEYWSVGLASIIYPKTWFNVKEKSPITFLDEDGNYIESKPGLFNGNQEEIPDYSPNSIPKGYYKTIDELIEVINKKLKNIAIGTVQPRLFYDSIRKNVVIRVGTLSNGKKYIPVFTEDIDKILGIMEDDGVSLSKRIITNANTDKLAEKWGTYYDEIPLNFLAGYFVGPKIADINAGFNTLYIYSDIVQQSCVGDAFAQLLRAIPVDNKENWDMPVSNVYNKPHLYPIQSRNFNTIEIDVKDDTGSTVHFEKGKLIVTLIFKRND